MTDAGTVVVRTYVKASAQQIWDAITQEEWTLRYGYGGHTRFDLRPGGALSISADAPMREGAAAMGFDLPDPILDGEVLEVDAPRTLRTTWRMLMDPSCAAEPFTTMTYEITEYDGYCGLVVTHDCTQSPSTYAMVSGAGPARADQGGGGLPWVIADLKSVLETGSRLGA